jgi:hypothetical protein
MWSYIVFAFVLLVIVRKSLEYISLLLILRDPLPVFVFMNTAMVKLEVLSFLISCLLLDTPNTKIY